MEAAFTSHLARPLSSLAKNNIRDKKHSANGNAFSRISCNETCVSYYVGHRHP